MEYLPVINEKTGGNPIKILTPDGPAAEEALAERTEILRKLSVTEIRRLTGSAMAVMAGFTARKQALHDLLAGTLVVKQD